MTTSSAANPHCSCRMSLSMTFLSEWFEVRAARDTAGRGLFPRLDRSLRGVMSPSGIRAPRRRLSFRTPPLRKGTPMRNRTILLGVVLAAIAAAIAAAGSAAGFTGKATAPITVQVFSPSSGDAVGKASRGFFVDLAVQYPSLAASGADLQLTGPTTHQNQAPFPGAFSPGVDEKLPGLIVLLSTSTVGAKNAQNLANLFNLTGFTNRKTNEIWDTWLVGAASFGKNVRSVLRVAVAADKNGDGIYNDAPAVVPDGNHDGRINAVDLKAFGVASEIVAVPFQISD